MDIGRGLSCCMEYIGIAPALRQSAYTLHYFVRSHVFDVRGYGPMAVVEVGDAGDPDTVELAAGLAGRTGTTKVVRSLLSRG